MYYIATVDHSLMRRDAKRVAEWDVQQIIPCHGDVIREGGNEAWASTYEWFLKGDPERSFVLRMKTPLMKLMRWTFLM
jgi:hypothetical protein